MLYSLTNKNFLVSLILLCIFYSAKAQIYDFKTYNIREGLIESQVFSIYQDSKGYLWFGTFGGGVSRFDGKNFNHYTVNDGLSSNIIFDIIEDEYHNMWFATYDGLTCLSNDTFKIIKTENGLAHNVVRGELVFDNAGNLLVGTNKGITKISLQNNKILSVNNYLDTTMEVSSKNISALCYDLNNNLWIGTTDGLFFYDGKTTKKYTKSNGLSSNSINAIFQSSNKDIYLGTMGGGLNIMSFKTKKINVYSKNEDILNPNIYAIIEDNEKNIWITTEKGIHLLKDNLLIPYTNENGLSNDVVVCAEKDNEGNLWFGTNGGGACQYRGNRFILYPTPSTTQAIGKDALNNMWFGTYGNGIYKLNSKQNAVPLYETNLTVNSGLISDRIWTFLLDNNNNFWVGGDGGVISIKNNKLHQLPQPPSESKWVHHLFQDDQDRIWVSLSAAEQSCIFQNNTYSTLDNIGFPSLLPEVTKVAQSTDGYIWIATIKGLFSYKNGNVNTFNAKNWLPKDRISSFDFDANGAIWLGIQGNGLAKFKEDEMAVYYTTKDGLSGDNVSMVYFDSKQNLWVGTNKGLDKIEFDSTGAIKHIYTYNEEKGFLGGACESNAAYEDEEGNIWFGTAEGVVKYNAHSDNINTKSPKMHITNIRLFMEETDWEKYGFKLNNLKYPEQISLSYDHNHITFDFIGISTTNPKNVNYSYKLEGLHNEWSPLIKENFATFSSLPSGNYVFSVKAMNMDGLWSNPVNYSFVIKAPFWKTWWFVLICIIIIVSLLFSYIKVREKNLRKTKKILTNKVKERTEFITKQKEKIELINKDITDSINYAKRIQNAILPSTKIVKQHLKDSFIFYKPKDIVAGDFYWMETIIDESRVMSNENPILKTQHSKHILFAAADCTGHGVPGAMISVVCHNALNRSVREYSLTDPREILNKTREIVIQEFEKSDEEVKDGMDIALCNLRFDVQGLKLKNKETTALLQYAGANNPLWIIRNLEHQTSNFELIEIKPNKQPIGKVDEPQPFTTHTIELQKGDTIYIFTDGFADQFGGEKGKKFMYKPFKELLLSIQEKTMDEQKIVLELHFDNWKRNLEQVDDVCIIGVRI